jgi:formylglycine-generating enzyme required for sulfatase activity
VFRLPTEAEWEFAARGGIKSKGYPYSGGEKLNDVAWHLGNSRNKPRAVGLKTPNELGLFDMSGNAREWCADWYGASYYATSPQNNPAGPATGTHRVMRGGFWGSFESHLGISKRNHEFPFHNALNTGFRIAREAD